MQFLRNKSKKIKIATGLVSSAFVIASIYASIQLNEVSNKSNIALKNKNLQALTEADVDSKQQTTSVLPDLDKNSGFDKQFDVPSKYTNQNFFKNIVNSNGPILSLDENRSVGAFDWYGNVSWFLRLNSSSDKASSSPDAVFSGEKFSNNTIVGLDKKEVGTKFVDWAYNANADLLYLLTDTCYMFLIQSETGILNNYIKLKNGSDDTKITKLAFIDFNQDLIGWDNTTQNPTLYKIDAQRLFLTKVSNDSGTKVAQSKYLLDILPVGVGYNVAVLSDQKPDQSSSELTLKLMQDEGVEFPNGNGNPMALMSPSSNPVTGSGVKISSVNKKPSEIYTNSFSIGNNNFVLTVHNKVINLNLNRNTVNQSRFSEVTGISAPINSAYKDQNNAVYIKTDDSSKVQRINANAASANDYLDLTTNAANVFPTNGRTPQTSDVAKQSRIFPVLTQTNKNVKTGINNTGYVVSYNNFAATGYQNGSVINTNFTSAARRPNFFLNGAAGLLSNQSPSIINVNNIQGSNNNVLNVIQQNSQLFSNDINGELYVKAALTTASWYDNTRNAVTVSNVLGKWNFAKIENIVSFRDQSVFNAIRRGIFTRLDPNQISERDLNRFALQIINLPASILTSQERNIQIVVKERMASAGKIKLAAVVTYLNQRGQRVSFQVADKEYQVRREAQNYAFKFVGGTKNLDKSTANNLNDIETVDVQTLPDSVDKFKKLIPSFINPTDLDIGNFIETQDKYPTDGRRVFRITNVNDNNGSLVLEVLYNNLEASTPAFFAIRYTGFQTLNSSRVNFEGTNASNAQQGVIPQSLIDEDRALFEKEKEAFEKVKQESTIKDSVISYIIRPKRNDATPATVTSPTRAGSLSSSTVSHFVDETTLQDTSNLPIVAGSNNTATTQTVNGVTITTIRPADSSASVTTSYNLTPLNITSVGKYTEYDKKLATETSDDDIAEVYSSQLTEMGFKPTIKVVKQERNNQIKDAEAEAGSILVEIDFKGSKSEELGIDFPLALFGDKFGLMNGKVYQRYAGFLPIGATYGVNLLPYDSEPIQAIVQKHNVNAPITIEELLSTLEIRGYLTENPLENNEPNPEDRNNVRISGFRWEGEDLKFNVFAQSRRYGSVRQNSEFIISWSPKFASIRARNLAASVGTAVLGVSTISSAVGFYIFRRNRIRRMMK